MFNKFLFVASLISATASAEVPLLVKSQDAGYTMPQYYQSFVCEIYPDRIVVSRSFGQSVESSETRMISLGGNVATLIEKSAAETFESSGTLCDAPSTRISAKRIENSETTDILLFGRSTCSQDGERTGENSTVLLNMANALCGEM